MRSIYKVSKVRAKEKTRDGRDWTVNQVRKFTVAGRPNTSSKLSNKHTETKTPKFPDARFSWWKAVSRRTCILLRTSILSLLFKEDTELVDAQRVLILSYHLTVRTFKSAFKHLLREVWRLYLNNKLTSISFLQVPLLCSLSASISV